MWWFLRKDAIEIWQQEEMKGELETYKGIYEGKKLPRYKLAKLFYVEIEQKQKEEEFNIPEEWKKHEEEGKKFREWIKENQEKTLKEVEEAVFNEIEQEKIKNNNYLKRKIRLARELLKSCEFCENRCKVNREKGEKGRCGVDGKSYLSSMFIHMGEEAPIIPSGTLFFYGCTMKCVFCQNYDISQEYSLGMIKGTEVTGKELAQIYNEVKIQGGRNINYVGGDPTPNIHTILESLEITEIHLPLLWNSNMYLTKEGMKLIVDIMDIWLPDMKYGNNLCGEKYSLVKNYWEILKRNMKMIEEKGSKEYIIRHLVMPEHIECCSKTIITWVKDELEKPLMNIMGQYRPEYLVQRKRDEYQEIARMPTREEMNKAQEFAEERGIKWKSLS